MTDRARRAGPFALVFWGVVLCIVVAATWGVTRMAARRAATVAGSGTTPDAPVGTSHASDAGEDVASSAREGTASEGSSSTVAPGTGTTTVVTGTTSGGGAPSGGAASAAEASTTEAGERPSGTLPAEVIRDVVREAIPYIRFCFEWQLERHPELGGRVTMAWTIQPDGTVTDADVVEDALGDETVLRCFRGVVGRLAFPPPEGGGTVTVRYPFVLAGSPEARRPEGI